MARLNFAGSSNERGDEFDDRVARRRFARTVQEQTFDHEHRDTCGERRFGFVQAVLRELRGQGHFHRPMELVVPLRDYFGVIFTISPWLGCAKLTVA